GKNYKVRGDMTYNEWIDSLSNEQRMAIKAYRNRHGDMKQYRKYTNRLGAENMPKTFDLFQKMKYNETEKWEDYKYYFRNIDGRPIEYVKIDRDLFKLGITNKGKAYPPDKTINAYILPDIESKDAYHIMKRMQERNISDDEIRSYKDNALISFRQWGGKRYRYCAENGICVTTKTNNGWIYKTAWKKDDFDDEYLKILGVIKKYVK
ncbi:MAG: hypothetical protein ACI4DY_13930, partial [Monoglobaceae bacterium]